MQKAVFLDRDGVINEERGTYTHKWEDFRFVEGLFDSLRRFQEHDYILIVITNQGGVAKGIYTEEDVQSLHAKMLAVMKREKIHITDIDYCPHHQDYQICECRKPKPLMLLRMMEKYNIDPKQSYFIGDSPRDIVAGEAAGVSSIKIEPNSSLKEIEHLIAGLQ